MLPESDIERFNFLKMHSPPAVDDLLKKIYTDIDKKRIEILEAERFINLSLLTRTTKYPEKFMPPMNEFIAMLENQVVLTSEEIDPSFVQHTSLLISYVYGNIDQLVKGVAAMSQSEEFPFIVSSMLPSIFGFFISAEYMQYALNFYKTFIRTQKKNLSLIVIQPFFCSIFTYRYIENVMESFLIKFGTETIRKNEPFPQEFMNKYSNLLTKLLIEALPLLPAAFFEIFKTVLEDKWNKTKLVHLFFSSFLKPQFLMYLRSSPFNDEGYVRQIIDNIARNDKYFTQIINSWYIAIPKYEIFPIYTPFKQVFVTLFLSIADVMMTTTCLLKGGTLPGVLDDMSCFKYGPEIKFNPLIVRIYTKELKVLPPKVDPLIMPLSNPIESNPNFDRTYRAMKSVIPKTTTVFEELLKHENQTTEFTNYALQKAIAEKQSQIESLENYLVAKYYHNRLIDLREIVRSREDFIKIPFVLQIAQSGKSFKDVSQTFLSNHAKRVLFLCTIKKNVHYVYDELIIDFRNLIKSWDQLSFSRRKNCELNFVNTMSKSRQENFWQACNIISCLTRVPIYRTFELLMKAIKMIYLINSERFHDLLRTAMIFSKSKFVPLVFELQNEFAIKNMTFREMLYENEYEIWIAFESFLLTYANGNPEKNENNDTRDALIQVSNKIVTVVANLVAAQSKKKTSKFKEKTVEFFEKQKEKLKKEKIEKEKQRREKQARLKLKKEQMQKEKLEKLKMKKEKQEKQEMITIKKGKDQKIDEEFSTEDTEETEDPTEWKEEEEEDLEERMEKDIEVNLEKEFEEKLEKEIEKELRLREEEEDFTTKEDNDDTGKTTDLL